MSGYSELKQACHDCNNLSGPELFDAIERFEALTTPDQVLALVKQAERLKYIEENWFRYNPVRKELSCQIGRFCDSFKDAIDRDMDRSK